MRLLAQALPARPSSPWVRFAATTSIVLVFCALRAGLPLEDSRFIIFVPPVFIASLVCGRACGFYATLLSAVAAETVFFPQPHAVLLDPAHLPSLTIFVLVCLGISVVNDGLRRALERVMETEAGARLLLEELGHRVKNNLQIIMSMLDLQQRRSPDPKLQLAFDAAIARIRVIAEAHDRLRIVRKGEAVDMRAYLEQLCHSLVGSVSEVRPIALRVEAAALTLPTEVAVPLGLIVNELVTNALKHAFPGEREGLIVVALHRDHDGVLILSVRDDGIGCPSDAAGGLGSRLIRLLVQQLKGSLVRRATSESGCEVLVTLPFGSDGAKSLATQPVLAMAER